MFNLRHLRTCNKPSKPSPAGDDRHRSHSHPQLALRLPCRSGTRREVGPIGRAAAGFRSGRIPRCSAQRDRLRGWACETRTQKRREKLSL